MKNIRFLAVVVSLFGLALPASADTLVVLNKSEHTASLIDPESGKTLAKLPVGRGPHEVIVSPDGHTAYVSNFGPYGICPAGDTMCKTPGNTITVLDLAERKVKATYDYGTNKGQHGSVISRDGKYIWVTSETPQSLLEIETATGKIVNQWMTKQERKPPRRRDAGRKEVLRLKHGLGERERHRAFDRRGEGDSDRKGRGSDHDLAGWPRGLGRDAGG